MIQDSKWCEWKIECKQPGTILRAENLREWDDWRLECHELLSFFFALSHLEVAEKCSRDGTKLDLKVGPVAISSIGWQLVDK